MVCDSNISWVFDTAFVVRGSGAKRFFSIPHNSSELRSIKSNRAAPGR